MRLLGTLLRIETIKTLRRFGFWMTVLTLAGLLVIIHGGGYYGAVQAGHPPPHLPDAWGSVALGAGPLAGIFGSVALILLVAAEFSWKTARQNVIDGLSKEQFFLGKLLLVPGLTLVFCSVQLGIGGGAALLGNLHLGRAPWPPVEPVHLGLVTGLGLQAAGFLTLAFLAAMIARTSGGAMGLFLLWAAVLEQLLAQLLREREGWLEAAADFLPVTVFTAVARAEVWSPEAMAAAVERAASQGRPPPEVLGAPVSVALAAGWIGALVLLSFAVYRRRDL